MSSSLILHNNNEPFLTQIVMCYIKWILYNDRRQLAQWLDREKSPECFSKSNLHHKKVMVTGGLLPAKPLHLWSMLSKSVTAPTAGAGQQRGPSSSPWQRLITHCTTSSFKSWTNWSMMVEFAHPPYSPFLSPTNYHFFKRLNFLQAKHFYKQQKGESAFQEFFESQSMDFFFFFLVQE